MCQKYRSGATVDELAREFNINRGTVSVHLKASGVTLRLQPPSEESIDEMVKLYRSGLSCAIIGAKLRLSPQTVLRRLKERGVELRGAHDPRLSLSHISVNSTS
jgi:DNA-binding CsgD family transcriptional regulator